MQTLNHKLYSELSSIYCQPTRYYHNIDHINHCIGELEKYTENNPTSFFLKREVFYALWFHDIIYNSYSKHNEENSADFFKQCAKEYDFSADEDLIVSLILGTKHHNVLSEKNEFEHNIVNDIDLSSLGQSETIYLKNSSNIRKEYGHVNNEDFKNNRIDFIDDFISRPQIFKTDYYYKYFENKTRKNLMKEKRMLLQQI